MMEFVVLLLLSLLVNFALPRDTHGGEHVFHLASASEDYRISCQTLFLLLKKKKGLVDTIDKTMMFIKASTDNHRDKENRLKILELFRREMKAAEASLLVALRDMDRTVNCDYKLLDSVKRTCEGRLQDTRDNSAQAEENYAAILSLEKDISSKHSNVSIPNAGQFLNDILMTLSQAADELEQELKEDTFERLLSVKGALLETVVKLRKPSQRGHHPLLGVEDPPSGNYSRYKGSGLQVDNSDDIIPLLVDSLNNRFVLSRPGDMTFAQEDHSLLHDLILIFILCFVLGALFANIGIPSHLAYMIAGTILGPSGYNVVTSVVQVETVGELGIMLILFVVALDLSPDNLRKIWKISFYGANLMTLASVALGMASSAVFDIHLLHGLFVGACLALSSTPLISRFLESTGTDASNTGYSGPLMGILIVQDVQLGALIAMMPLLCIQTASGVAFNRLLQSGIVLCVTILCLLLVCRIVSQFVIDRLFKLLNSFFNKKESIVIGAIGVCFFFAWISDQTGVSIELGCFLAGLAISFRGQSPAKDIRELIEPIRNFLMCYFFSSAGFYIFPTFLLSEWCMLIIVTLVVVGGKLLLAALVVGLFQGYRKSHTWIIATGLAQVSEFSIVLGSRARRLRIVTREVYLVILSVSVLSLLLAPLLWKVALSGWSFHQVIRSVIQWCRKQKSRTLSS